MEIKANELQIGQKVTLKGLMNSDRVMTYVGRNGGCYVFSSMQEETKEEKEYGSVFLYDLADLNNEATIVLVK